MSTGNVNTEKNGEHQLDRWYYIAMIEEKEPYTHNKKEAKEMD